MYAKRSPPQQNDMAEAWTAGFLVLGQAIYHWGTLYFQNLKKNLLEIFLVVVILLQDFNAKLSKFISASIADQVFTEPLFGSVASKTFSL